MKNTIGSMTDNLHQYVHKQQQQQQQLNRRVPHYS